MADTLLLIIAAAAAYLGFALFALSQSRHWQQVAPPAILRSRRRGKSCDCLVLWRLPCR